MAYLGEIFGNTKPDTFDEALKRLPSREETGLNLEEGDEDLKETREHLAGLRGVLYETLVEASEGEFRLLEDRMVPLSQTEIDLMEPTTLPRPSGIVSLVSLQRGSEIQNFEWSALPGDSIWNVVFETGDDRYYAWKISFVDPPFEPLDTLIEDYSEDEGGYKTFEVTLLCIMIETVDNRNVSEYNIGIVTNLELQALLEDLNSHRI